MHSNDPEQIQPFTDLLNDLINDILHDPGNMIQFGDLFPAVARIVLWFKWENKDYVANGAIHSVGDHPTIKVERMTKVLNKMIDCYLNHYVKLYSAGITLYAATVEPHTSLLKMEFIFNPAFIAEEFFKQLAHSRTLERLTREEWYKHERARYPDGLEEITKEALGTLHKCLVKKAP